MTLIAASAVAAAVALGRWQLSRAAQKEALQAAVEARKRMPALDSESFIALQPATAEMHRPVHLRGLWLPTHTVYLDNRQMNGATGFYVLTPFALEGSQQTVLVQRGWIPRNMAQRTQLAPVSTPSGLVEITGLIEPGPARLFELGGKDAAKAEDAKAGAAPSADPAAQAAQAGATAGAVAGAPEASGGPASTPPAGSPASTAAASSTATGSSRPADAPHAAAGTSPRSTPPTSVAPVAQGASAIRQNLGLEEFRTETRLPLRTDVSLLQTGEASEGLQRNWPAPALGIEKHYGYAFQWFGLAALFVILYVWFQLIAPYRRARRLQRG